MTLFPWKLKYVEKEKGSVFFFFFFEDEWVGSYQARSCKRSDEVSVELQVPLPG